MNEEWELLESVGIELYYFLNSIGKEYYEGVSDRIVSACGRDIKIKAYKNDNEALFLKAECMPGEECGDCKYSVNMISRPYEDIVKRRSLGYEYFFTYPIVLLYISREELENIILGLEKGFLEITFIDNSAYPFLEAKLSPVKGTTLYGIYEMSKRDEDRVHVFLEPEQNSRYSLMFLSKDSARKLVPLADQNI